MGSSARYSAVNAKVRAQEGRMLDKDQIMKLLECKSFQEALFYLNDHTDYGRLLGNHAVESIHRGQLELILKREHVKKLDQFIHYFSGIYKDLLRILFIRYEIEDIKVIIRGKLIKKSSLELDSLVTHESSLSTISYEELLKAEDIEEVVEKLKDTIYYRHIANLSKDVHREGFFPIETELDFVYYIQLRKFLKNLGPEDRLVLERINGIQCDLQNLQWIYRAKKYYDISPAIVLGYTIYDGFRLNKEKLKELSYAKSIEDFIEMLKGMPYERLFRVSEREEYLLERDILSYLKKIYLSYKKAYRTNISVLISFFELAYLEMRDVITIVENKRYSVNTEESLKYITALR